MTDDPVSGPSTLDGLRQEFPGHRITHQTVGGRAFYLAETTIPGVRPTFAQAETADRLRSRLRTPEAGVNAAEPSVARVYDVLLGGKDNFGPDREQAARMLEIFPQSAELVRHARQFQARAVTWLVDQGIRQFLDLGCGLPTAPNTHETAQATEPGARIAYVDHDAQVLSHAGNLLAQTSGVLVCGGDLHYPAEILYDRRIREFLDFGQPVGVILAMTLHFFPAEQARTIAAQVIAALPVGSYLVLSVVGGEPELGDDLADAYTAADVHNHGADGLAGFTKGLELVQPGIVEARRWPGRADGGLDDGGLGDGGPGGAWGGGAGDAWDGGPGGRRGDAWVVVARVT